MKLSGVESGYLISSVLGDFTRRLTVDLAGWATAASSVPVGVRRDFLDGIEEVIRDPDPDRSIAVFSRSPAPFFRPGVLSGGRIPPTKKWQTLLRATPHWPAPVRACARLLGQDPDRLPSWKRIEAFYSSMGFVAFPVRGYVGAPVYSHLISRKKAPVCTMLVDRFRGIPPYIAPTDLWHDLGHGLAMGMEDYRLALLAFAGAALETGSYLKSRDMERAYGRYFEYSYSLAPDGRAFPIGAAAFSCDILKVDRSKLVPITRCRSSPESRTRRPFQDRNDWYDELLWKIAEFRERSICRPGLT